MVKTNKTHILNLYLKHHKEATVKYGPSVVLMQVGSFSEIYSPVNEDSNIETPDLKELSDITNCSIAIKNKGGENEHFMIGWPKIADSKYIPVLIKHGYHVVLVEQSTDGSSTHIKREITNIVSAGTAMNYDNNINNYLMSIYIENYENNNKVFHGCGVSVIDISTGKNNITHILDNPHNNRDYEALVIHLVNIYSPSEVIIHNLDTSISKQDYIRIFNIPHENILINFFQQDLKKMVKIDYQNNFLNEIFNFNTQTSPIENIHCETKPESVLSYILLLEYCHQHRKNVKNNIEIPEEIENINYLNLTNNSIRQINIISNSNNYKGSNDSLITILNKCKTPMGKRLLKERILKPFIEPEDITKSYDYIELFLKNNFYENIRQEISKISDIEKSIRKMGLNEYKYEELFSDNISFDYIKSSIELLKSDPDINTKLQEYSEDIDLFNEFLNDINNQFEWDNFNTINSNNIIERSLFKKDVYPEIDEIDEEIYKNKKNLDYICERLSKFIDQNNNSNNPLPVKIEYTDKDNYYIYTTNTRGLKLKDKFKNLGNQNIIIKDDDSNVIYTLKPQSFSFKTIKGSACKIELNEIGVISNSLIKLNKSMSFLNQKYWNEYIEKSYKKYNKSLKNICKLISEIDFYSNAAYISIKNRYHKPNITLSDKSFLDVKEIRHPIIELINDKHEYITNDISFGLDDKHDGVLLFGTNSCGKSSLMKAIGLNIVMAQSGMYAAALQFNYYPYKKLYTRILNTDNIFSGHSSFIVEMNELREILYSSDKFSMVLADELAVGTETTSALSIVSSSLKILCDRKVSFICTSHLHQLNNISTIKGLKNLKTYHLKITNENEKIIYDRVLEEGSGPAVYGLNVCNALNMSQDFISLARQVQIEINSENNNIISNKKSTYNKSICMGKCSMPMCDNDAEETHHINEQSDADAGGNFDHFHKNKKHNLIPLCKDCHAQITYGNLHIFGYKESSEGDVLDFKFIEKKQEQKKTNKKFSDYEVKKIEKYYNKYNGILSKQKILDKLQMDENIKMGIQTYNKIIKGDY
jgi:DNA mismatch repair protein MutS